MSENQQDCVAELEAKFAERTREIDALYAALAPLKTSGTLDQLLEEVIERLMHATGADAALIRVKDMESGQFYCRAARGFDERYLESAWVLPKSTPAVDFVFTQGQPILSPDIGADERIVDKSQVEFGYVSCAYLPLTAERSVRGIVHLASRARGFFRAEKAAHLTAIARQMSIAIENHQLFEQSERRSRELNALYAIADAVRFSTDVPIIAQMALMTTLKVSGLDAGRLYLLAEEDSLLRLTAQQNMPEEGLEGIQSYAPGAGLIGSIYKKNEIFVSRAPTGHFDTHASDRESQAALANFSVAIGVPIVIRERPIGVLLLHGCARREFASQDLSLLSAIGRQIGSAIDNAWLYERSQKSLERIRALHDIDLAIVNTMNLETVLAVLLEKIELFLTHNAVSSIRLVDRESGALEPVACRNLEESEWKKGLGKKSGIADAVFETKLPLVIGNVQTDPRTCEPEFFVRHGLVSYIGAPLMVKDQMLGVLGYYTKKEHHFTSDEIEFFVTLAGQGAIAIYNSQMYDEIKKQAAELENSNKVKEEFLCVISHELKTPLTAVMGYAMMLEEEGFGKNTPEQARAARVMRKNCDDLLALIGSILETTKLEAGVSALDREPVDISEMLEELERSYKVFRDHGLEMRWEYPPGLPTILTDRSKLTHILQNLINNALKFTPKGRVRISAFHDIEASVMRFEVEDTGVGIDPEKLPLIFEKFRQVDSSDRRIFEGAGLGLFLVKGFAEILGGKVSVESEVGKGSTFRVTVPCHDAVSLLCEVADHGAGRS